MIYVYSCDDTDISRKASVGMYNKPYKETSVRHVPVPTRSIPLQRTLPFPLMRVVPGIHLMMAQQYQIHLHNGMVRSFQPQLLTPLPNPHQLKPTPRSSNSKVTMSCGKTPMTPLSHMTMALSTLWYLMSAT